MVGAQEHTYSAVSSSPSLGARPAMAPKASSMLSSTAQWSALTLSHSLSLLLAWYMLVGCIATNAEARDLR